MKDECIETRKEIFFLILKKLILEERVRLVSSGVFLNSTINEQIELFKVKWPVNPEEDDLDGFWFLIDSPAGLVWIDEDDGSYIWT